MRKKIPGRSCSNCQTVETPVWRKGENGSILCNSCGLYWSKNGENPIKHINSPKKLNPFEVSYPNVNVPTLQSVRKTTRKRKPRFSTKDIFDDADFEESVTTYETSSFLGKRQFGTDSPVSEKHSDISFLLNDTDFVSTQINTIPHKKRKITNFEEIEESCSSQSECSETSDSSNSNNYHAMEEITTRVLSGLEQNLQPSPKQEQFIYNNAKITAIQNLEKKFVEEVHTVKENLFKKMQSETEKNLQIFERQLSTLLQEAYMESINQILHNS